MLDEQPLIPGREPAAHPLPQGRAGDVSAPGAAGVGEDAVNRGTGPIDRALTGSRARPIRAASNLIAELRKEATTPEDQALITDLFEKDRDLLT